MADSIQSQNASARKPSATAEYHRAWRARNAEKCRQASRKWRAKSEDYRRNKRLLNLYGVTLEQYEAVLERQNGVCAICNETSRDGRRLAVDHCHYTGKIRGLLCFHCNSAIGKLGDTSDKVARAVKYLKDGGL